MRALRKSLITPENRYLLNPTSNATLTNTQQGRITTAFDAITSTTLMMGVIQIKKTGSLLVAGWAQGTFNNLTALSWRLEYRTGAFTVNGVAKSVGFFQNPAILGGASEIAGAAVVGDLAVSTNLSIAMNDLKLAAGSAGDLVGVSLLVNYSSEAPTAHFDGTVRPAGALSIVEIA